MRVKPVKGWWNPRFAVKEGVYLIYRRRDLNYELEQRCWIVFEDPTPKPEPEPIRRFTRIM